MVTWFSKHANLHKLPYMALFSTAKSAAITSCCPSDNEEWGPGTCFCDHTCFEFGDCCSDITGMSSKVKSCLVITETGLWFSWGVASLPEGKSQDLCSVQLCVKYNKHYIKCQKIKKLLLSKWKVDCTAASWSHVPSGSWMLNWRLETVTMPRILWGSLLGLALCFTSQTYFHRVKS